MNCLILAAGYATRLYPLTENFPKPLLEVGGKTILDRLMDDLDTSGRIGSYTVVSNHRFTPTFHAWADARFSRTRVPVRVVDDGTLSNETRLGAVKDICLGAACTEGDLLVMAGDNLLSFGLDAFLAFAAEKGTSCLMRYAEPDPARLRRCGVLELGPDGRVLSMEEKPAEPRSHWCCPPFYIYRRADLDRIDEALAQGCSADAPGSFAAWLCRRAPVYAWEMPGPRYDIGTLESYARVQEIFKSESL